MGQKYYIIYMVVASFAAFVYFKLKDNEFEKRDKVLFVLGIILFSFGAMVAYLTQGYTVLVEYLTLKNFHIAGKFIFVGYVFILLAFFFFLDRQLSNLFKKKR